MAVPPPPPATTGSANCTYTVPPTGKQTADPATPAQVMVKDGYDGTKAAKPAAPPPFILVPAPHLVPRPNTGFFGRIADWFVNAGGWLVGHLELLIGCFYPVTLKPAEKVSPGLWRGPRVDNL